MRWKPLFDWMIERHMIYIRRKTNPWPWTRDKIMQQYRFCNVYRELDTVTIWVRKNIREEYEKHPNLWFMLAIARQINWPETLQELMDGGAWPTKIGGWNPALARRIMLARQARGDKLYTGAYILNGQLGSKYKEGMDDKAYYTCHVVLQSVWDARGKIIPAINSGSLQVAHEAFLECFGWGPFTAYEVVCDLRYTRYLRNANDKNFWANPGPGAKRGLDRLAERPKSERPSVETMIKEMRWLHEKIAPEWSRKLPTYPALELREIEHSLCEFDKYERTRRGQGRPRSTYEPPSSQLSLPLK